ncbi:50S ribosomal protein L4 [Candidatus Woesearchaeota archaeon]|nr:50S ribosomal protein L4 [Candidatus Woesearchaeota archaeon]
MQQKQLGLVELPKQFSEEIRFDLVQRAIMSLWNNKRQPYGSYVDAGDRHSVKISKQRHDFKGCYGFGISRVPRKILSRNGIRFNWVAAQAPGTVGGRRAHPPKATKNWEEKLNKKERRKAIRSAMAAVMQKELVAGRGHHIPTAYPFIIETPFESLSKTKEVVAVLHKLGFEEELSRTEQRSVRAGKGKRRGRKYKTKKGILLVVSGDCKLQQSAKNIPGVDVVAVNTINAELLAPGFMMGRITLFTQAAIERVQKEQLFM